MCSCTPSRSANGASDGTTNGTQARVGSLESSRNEGYARSLLSAMQCAARTCVVLAAFAFALTAPYDNLIALAGGLCVVPLAFIFPGWLHLKACGWRRGGAVDVVLMGFGAVMAPVATLAAVLSWQ